MVCAFVWVGDLVLKELFGPGAAALIVHRLFDELATVVGLDRALGDRVIERCAVLQVVLVGLRVDFRFPEQALDVV